MTNGPVRAIVATSAGAETGSGDSLGRSLAVLGGVLANGIDVHRCLAARALGRIGHAAAVGPLVEALLDEDEDVRTDAAEALAAIDAEGAEKQLLENLLGDPCSEVKLAAMSALARRGNADVVPWLRRLLKGRDEAVAWDEDEFHTSGWDDWLDIQRKAIEALADLGVDAAVPDIVDSVAGEDVQDVSEIAFPALARLGDAGIAALDDFLAAEDVRHRRRAAAALAGIDADAAAGPLDRAFQDPAPEVRLAAAQVLAQRNATDSRLAGLFDDGDSDLRAAAVRFAGRHHPKRLPDLLEDPSVEVAAAVLEVLAVPPAITDAPSLAEPLRAILAGSSARLAALAGPVLAVVAGSAARDDLIVQLTSADRPLEVRLGALRGLFRIADAAAVTALTAAVGDEARFIRIEAMTALASLAKVDGDWPNAAADALLAALQGGLIPPPVEEVIREDTAADGPCEGDETRADETMPDKVFPTSTLASILEDDTALADRAGLPAPGVELTQGDMERLALARRIKGKKNVPLVPRVVVFDDVRRFAARVLGDLDRSQVIDALAVALGDDDSEVRLAAAESLARIGARGVRLADAVGQALVAVAADENRNLRLMVVRALGASDADITADTLQRGLADADSFVRSEAVRSLARRGLTGASTVALLDDDDPETRLTAARSLAQAADDDAIGRLVDFAFSHEGYHGREAGKLMRRIDAAEASSRLLAVLDDPDRARVWSVAIETLEELHRAQQPAVG